MRYPTTIISFKYGCFLPIWTYCIFWIEVQGLEFGMNVRAGDRSLTDFIEKFTLSNNTVGPEKKN